MAHKQEVPAVVGLLKLETVLRVGDIRNNLTSSVGGCKWMPRCSFDRRRLPIAASPSNALAPASAAAAPASGA
jgi:hypothetical protein